MFRIYDLNRPIPKDDETPEQCHTPSFVDPEQSQVIDIQAVTYFPLDASFSLSDWGSVVLAASISVSHLIDYPSEHI